MVHSSEDKSPDLNLLSRLSLTTWEIEASRGKFGDDPNAHSIMLQAHKQLQEEIEELNLIVPEMRSEFLLQEKVEESVLLVHGSTGSPTDVQGLAEHLYENGYSVCNILLPGHGVDGSALPDVKWKACLNEVDLRYGILERFSSRVHVVGFSFGASLALLLAGRRDPADLVLLSPALNPKVSFGSRIMLSLGLHKLPFVRRRVGWNLEVFEAMEKARSMVGKLKLPIYAAHCEDDYRIDPSSLRFLQKRAKHKASRFRLYKDGGHMILDAHGADSLHGEVLSFLKGGQRP